MKANAVVRIVLYSLVILLLLGILLTCFGAGTLAFILPTDTSEYVTGSQSIDASGVSNLKISWAAGSITIQTADTDQITFSESGNFDEDQAMAYSLKGDTLTIRYSKPSVQIGFVSIPSKDLVITVPQDWVCEELELDGASLDVEIDGLSIRELDLDGASNTVNLTGAVETVDCDGASCELTLICTDRPRKIDLDGASCQLELTLPADCGFLVQMDGLSCDFDSDLDYMSGNGDYMYGDRYCQIDADGVSCSISIYENK